MVEVLGAGLSLHQLMVILGHLVVNHPALRSLNVHSHPEASPVALKLRHAGGATTESPLLPSNEITIYSHYYYMRRARGGRWRSATVVRAAEGSLTGSWRKWGRTTARGSRG